VIKKAVIPAAGYGTRNLPITKVIPKEMFPISGKPAIHYIVEEAIAAGIEELLIILSRSKNAIIDYFDDSPELEAYLEMKNRKDLLQKVEEIPKVHIQFVRQPKVAGLGDAIYLAKNFVGNEPFAILLPDDIILGKKNQAGISELIEFHNQLMTNVLALKEVEMQELQNYGVIKGNKINKDVFKIEDVIEKPTDSPPSNLAIVGRYILNPTIFNYLENASPGAGGEIQLTDAIKLMLGQEKSYGKILEGLRFDIGKEEEYIQLINYMSKKN
jgi:UTP--glucose-1-phosphate uridylyltransferase